MIAGTLVLEDSIVHYHVGDIAPHGLMARVRVADGLEGWEGETVCSTQALAAALAIAMNADGEFPGVPLNEGEAQALWALAEGAVPADPRPDTESGPNPLRWIP